MSDGLKFGVWGMSGVGIGGWERGDAKDGCVCCIIDCWLGW